jgi:hypothetical protein
MQEPKAVKTARISLVLLLAVVANGCYAACDALTDASIRVRNRMWARQAWDESCWRGSNAPHLDDFHSGFAAGYMDVASGKNGCPPPLPPRKYWSPSRLDSQGRQESAAWYNGYAQGVLAARERGVSDWSRLQSVKPSARGSGVEPQFAQVGGNETRVGPTTLSPAARLGKGDEPVSMQEVYPAPVIEVNR